MKKNEIRVLAFAGIALIAYNVIAFALPFNMGAAFWISYVFSMVAILVQLPIMRIAFKNGTSVRSKFYGFPIARIGVTYAIIQIILSIVVMALGSILPVWIPIVLYVLILCISAAGFIAADAMRDEVVRQDVKLENNVSFMRALQSKANFIVSQCSDDEVKRAVKAYADSLRYSDPVSNDALAEIENELSIYTDELQKAVMDEDDSSVISLCKKTEALLAERNRLCKLNKSKI